MGRLIWEPDKKIIYVEPDPEKYPVFGCGKETVYVYYYTTYKLFAEQNNIGYFPCKIGKTVNTVEQRLKEQQVAMPEAPIIPFIINCYSSTDLEFKLQESMNKKAEEKNRTWETWLSNYNTDGGADWVLATPEEILIVAKKAGYLSKTYNDRIEKKINLNNLKIEKENEAYRVYLEDNEIIKEYCKKHGISTQITNGELNKILKLAKNEMLKD